MALRLAFARPWSIRPSRRFTASARASAILLLLVWLGPVSFAATDTWQLLRWAGAPAPASAETQVIPAGQALVLEPGTPLKLWLRDDSVVQGKFLGRALLDSSLYAPRFAAYARTSDFVPFALGETLRVSLRDGREWSAPFAGYGEMTLLLKGAEGSDPRRVPFEFVREVRGANGAWVQPKALTREFRKGSLPSAEAIALGERAGVGTGADQWTNALRVAVQDIKSAAVELPSGGSVAGVVLVSALVTVVLFYVLLAASLRSTSSTSCSSASSFPGFLGGMSLHLTTRPYDRTRSCYADDPPPMADAAPGGTEVPPVAASAAPTGPPAVTAPQNAAATLSW